MTEKERRFIECALALEGNCPIGLAMAVMALRRERECMGDDMDPIDTTKDDE